MSAVDMSQIDLEQGTHRRSATGSDTSCFSEVENGSCNSQFYSTHGGSYDDYSFGGVSDSEVVSDSRKVSSAEVENVVPEIKVHLGKVERECRICHLNLESNSHESGLPIELGCSCKNDLAAAHKHCAEAWFKIKGNKTCEICHSVARNVRGANEIESTEQLTDSNSATAMATVSASVPNSDAHSFCQGHRFLNFLLACMVFAFVISWLLHFNMPS